MADLFAPGGVVNKALTAAARANQRVVPFLKALAVAVFLLAPLLYAPAALAAALADGPELLQPPRTLEKDVQSAYFDIRADGVYCNGLPVGGEWHTSLEWAADPRTFEVIDERAGYGRDEDHVYFCNRRLPDANPATFKIMGYLMGSMSKRDTAFKPMSGRFIIGNLWSAYASDGKNLYYNDAPLRGADLESFEILHGHSGYARDKNYIFYHNMALDLADRDSFRVLGGSFAEFVTLDAHSLDLKDVEVRTVSYASDKYQVFKNQSQLPHVFPESFNMPRFGNEASFMRTVFGRPVPYAFGVFKPSEIGGLKDKTRRIKGDPDSWEYLAPGWSRDKFAAYYLGYRVDGLNPDYFKLLPEDNRYATDGQYLFFGNKRVFFADPEKFHPMGDAGFAADGRYVWRYSGMPLLNASGASFRLSYDGNHGFDDARGYWFADEPHFFGVSEEKPTADAPHWPTLRQLSPHSRFLRDKDRAYYEYEPIKASAGSFTSLGSGPVANNEQVEFGTDGKYIFRNHRVLMNPAQEAKRSNDPFQARDKESDSHLLQAKHFSRLGGSNSGYFRYVNKIFAFPYNSSGYIPVTEDTESFRIIPRYAGPQWSDLAMDDSRLFVNGIAKGRAKGAWISIPWVPGAERYPNGDFWLLTEGRALFKDGQRNVLPSVEADGRSFRLLPGYVYATDGTKIFCKGKEVEGADAASFVPVAMALRMKSALGYDARNIYAFEHVIASTQGQPELVWPQPRQYAENILLRDEANLYLLSSMYDRMVRSNFKITLRVLPLPKRATVTVLAYVDEGGLEDKSIFFTDGTTVFWGDVPLPGISPRSAWRKVELKSRSSTVSLFIAPDGLFLGKYGHLHAESETGEKIPIAPKGLKSGELSEEGDSFIAFDGRFHVEVSVASGFSLRIWEDGATRGKWKAAPAPEPETGKLKLTAVRSELE